MTMTKRESEKVSARGRFGAFQNSLLEVVGGLLQGFGSSHANCALQAGYLCHAFAGGTSFYPVSQLAFTVAPGTKPTGSMAGGIHEIRAAYAG